MARVNTPESYTSHMSFITKPEDLRSYKYKKAKTLCERVPDPGFMPFVINSPTLSYRDFFIHLRKPGTKVEDFAYSYFKWNNIDFKYRVFDKKGKRYITVEAVGGEYKCTMDITKISLSNYKKYDKTQKLARYLTRLTIIAVRIAQTLIENYGKEALQKGNRYWDPKITVIENVVSLLKLVRSRKFAWREQYYKNIEIRKAKTRRYRNAMKIANNPENVKRGLAIMKSIVNDPNSAVSKIIKDNPGVLKEISKEDARSAA